MTVDYQNKDIVIHKVKCGPYDNNSYLIRCLKTNESILVDTPGEPDQLIEIALQTNVKYILITHNHFDHLAGFTDITSKIKAPVGIGEADADALPMKPDIILRDGEDVPFGNNLSIKLISTPGHTPGSTCLSIGDRLFTGDTLFPGGPGKTDSPEALAEIIQSITSKLFVLGNKVTFYPGHGDNGQLDTSRDEYHVYSTKEHPENIYGDVLWLDN